MLDGATTALAPTTSRNPAARADIRTDADCEALVRGFYGRALRDPVIGFLFTDIAQLDLEAHITRITRFWATVLLGARSYGGGAFRPHLQLHTKAPLRRGHFERWLALWNATVDEMFSGVRAELAKAHADRVANAFVARLRALDEQRGESAPGAPSAGQSAPGAPTAGQPAPVELPLVHHYGHGRSR